MGKLVTVEFRNDTIFAVERDDGLFVAIKPICETLGLDWKAQHRRITNDPILAEGMVTTAIPSLGGAQETTCLRFDLVNGWLFTIDESRVRDEDTRQRVLTYKRECYSVLFNHFFGKSTAPVVTEDDEPHESDASKIKLVQESRHVFGNTAAAQMWFKLGLPIVPAMIRDERQAELFSYTAVKGAPEKRVEEAA